MLPEKIKKLLWKSVDKKNSLDIKLANILSQFKYDGSEMQLQRQSPAVNAIFNKNMCTDDRFIHSINEESIDETFPATESLSGEIPMNFLLEYSKHSGNFSDLSYEGFSRAIFKILCSEKSDDQLQDELFDMLGFNSFEFISNLLTNRQYYCQPDTSKLFIFYLDMPVTC